MLIRAGILGSSGARQAKTDDGNLGAKKKGIAWICEEQVVKADRVSCYIGAYIKQSMVFLAINLP